MELLTTGLRWGLTALALTIALDSIVWRYGGNNIYI